MDKIRDLEAECDYLDTGHEKLGGYSGCTPYDGNADIVKHNGWYDNTIGNNLDSDNDTDGHHSGY